MADEQDNGRRGLMAALPVALFGALAVILAAALFWGDPSDLPSALIGKPVPAFDLPPIEGLADVPGLSDSDLTDGTVSVVNVWASWCAPCRAEHPLLMSLAARIAQMEGVRLAGLNNKDAPENARRFLGQFGNPFSAVGADATGRVAIDWGVYGVPETFVVDGAGIIRFKHVGPLTPESLDADLMPAIEAARAASKAPQSR